MSILDIFKDKLSEVELRNRIKKELQHTALETVLKYKQHPSVEAALLKDAIGNLYKHSVLSSNPANTPEDIYNNPIFYNLLKEKVLEVISELLAENEASTADKPSYGITAAQTSHMVKKDNLTGMGKKDDEDFVLPKVIRHFDRLRRCETAIKKGLIKTKEEEADYLVQLMEQEDELIQEGKLCPNCHALNTIKNKHCYNCGHNIIF